MSTAARMILSLVRKVRRVFKYLDCRIRGVDIHWTTNVHPAAILEPSGGTIKIGEGTYIDRGVILRALGGSIEIGSHCSVNAYSVILGTVAIRDNSRLAPQVIVVAGNHKFSDKSRLIMDQGMSYVGISIENDVWIGAGARILDGVVLGRGTVVGAGSVVTKSTLQFEIVAGVPAKPIGERL